MRTLSARVMWMLLSCACLGACDGGSVRSARDASDDGADGNHLIDGGDTRDAATLHPTDGGSDADNGSPDAAVDAAHLVTDAGTPEALFVAVGYGMRRSRSLDGRAWLDGEFAQPQGDDPNLLRGVGFDHGRFVAVGNRVQYSDDGAAWLDSTYDEGDFLSDVVWSDGVWVAAGGNGTRVSSEDDGVTFVSRGSYISGHFRSIASGNGAVVAVGHGYGSEDGKGLRATTIDGIEWEPEVLDGPVLRGVAFANGVFVAIGNAGRCMRSSDGLIWSQCAVAHADLTAIRVVDGAFVIRIDSDEWVRSTDGIVFEPIVTTSSLPDLLVYGNGVYVGANWTSLHAATSLEGPYQPVYSMEPGFADLVFGWRNR